MKGIRGLEERKTAIKKNKKELATPCPCNDMQDGVTCHRFKIISEFLKKKVLNSSIGQAIVRVSRPIYTLWEVLKNKAADKHPSSTKDIGGGMKNVW